MELVSRGTSRSMRSASSPVEGSCTGNWIDRGLSTSSNVPGPGVKVSSTSSPSIVPKKWNVYWPGRVGMNQAR